MPVTQSQTKNWQKTKLGDFAVFNYGKGLPGRDRVAGYYPVYGSAGVVDTNKDYLVEGPGIVVGRKGSIGEIYYTDKNYFPIDTVYYITKGEKYNIRFLYYLLKTIDFKSLNSDAAVPGLNRNTAYAQEVLLPKTETQKQIAEVLSAYDDLIENNTKRIKILEQIAQAIYKEWFVKPVSNGKLPNGWEISTLGEHLIELESGSRPRGGVGEIKKGVPSVGAENINGIGQHNHNSEKYIDKKFFEKMKRGVVQDRDVALYKDGAYIGRTSYFRDEFPHKNFAVNEHVFLLRSSGERVTQNFLYLWLQEPDTIHEIRATNANAAQPGINQPGVRGLKIILPPQKIVETFDAKVEPMLASLINLAKQNNELRQARDLLLPKLVTGEVGVGKAQNTIQENAGFCA